MKRILTATVLILAVFALIFFGQLWMITLFSAIVAELAAYEYLKLAAVGAEAHDAKLRIPVWWMALGTALAFVVTLPDFPVEAQLPVLSALTLALFAWNGFRSPLIQVLPDTAQGLFGLHLHRLPPHPYPAAMETGRRPCSSRLPHGLCLGRRHRRPLHRPRLR